MLVLAVGLMKIDAGAEGYTLVDVWIATIILVIFMVPGCQQDAHVDGDAPVVFYFVVLSSVIDMRLVGSVEILTRIILAGIVQRGSTIIDVETDQQLRQEHLVGAFRVIPPITDRLR